MPSVFIATPMYGGMCYSRYTASLVRVTPVFLNAQVGFSFTSPVNESLITRGRDRLAHDFMQTGCTHLMFIDSDIGFQAEDILSMIAADKDIICGLYPRKEIDWTQVSEAARNGVEPEELRKWAGVFVVNTFAGNEAISDSHQPLEVAGGGCGFMLIKREVLEGLADKVPSYIENSGPAPRTHQQYFDTSIDPDYGVLLSEDFHFCRLARDHGYRVWVAPWVELSHTGTYSFSGLLRQFSAAQDADVSGLPDLQLPGVTQYAQQYEQIGGWFSAQDFQWMDGILAHQLSAGIDGDLLEIGVFRGKCAILLGYGKRENETLTLCDLFADSRNHPALSVEEQRHFTELDVDQFDRNWDRFHPWRPDVRICDSVDLDLGDRLFRFSHIDGCHAYEWVKRDIAFTASHTAERGVIVIDDLWDKNFPGVAAAVWESRAEGVIHPICTSEKKMYAARNLEDQQYWWNTLRQMPTTSDLLTCLFPTRLAISS